MGQSKKEQRTDLRRVLANLDSRWLAAASRKLSSRLLETLASQVKCQNLLVWVAHFPGEVDLTPLVSELITKVNVFLPKISPDGTMEFFQIEEGYSRKLSEGAYGVPEPREVGGMFDEAAAEDSVICLPGLGFDLSGNRLGRGRGFYDRYLMKAGRSSLTKIGVCWELQLIPSVCADSEDVQMDWIVTEEQAHFVKEGRV